MSRVKNTRKHAEAGEAFGRLVAEAVADMPEIQLVYLFGSQVTGNIGPASDYDFGVLLDSTAVWPQIRAELGHRLAKALDTGRIDLVLLNRAPIELAFAVIAQAIAGRSAHALGSKWKCL